MIVRGMWGVGDCIAGRSILRELMKKEPLGLETFYVAMYHDLIDLGMGIKMMRKPPPRIAELSKPKAFALQAFPASPPTGPLRLTYSKHSTLSIGTQLGAQFASIGMTMPEAPDFSLPVPRAWKDIAQTHLARWNMSGKPLMIYRPIARNEVWRCDNRSPDPKAYAELVMSIRHSYFVVSIADLTRREWIVIPDPPTPWIKADVELHHGELPFETLAGLFSLADLVFANPGFVPIMAQAIGTPVVIVYGGNERFSTTNIVGQHLAPTLAIEPKNPCGCHEGARPTHVCEKEIDIAAAIIRLQEFAEMYGRKQQCAS